VAAFPWSVLGIKKTTEERAIKSAYAKKLKVTRPEDDPVAFQRLVEARDVALRLARLANASQERDEIEVQPIPVSTIHWREEVSNSPIDQREQQQRSNFVEPFEQILIGDLMDKPFESIERLADKLRELTIAERLEIEPQFLLALDQYFSNQSSTVNQPIDSLHSSYQKYLVILLDQEYQWSNNERRIYEVVPYLSSEFADHLRRLINPHYVPSTAGSSTRSKPYGWMIWMAIMVFAYVGRACSNQNNYDGQNSNSTSDSNYHQSVLWRKATKIKEPATNWTYHLPPVGPP
jgi:hypothetical protein